MNTEPATNPDIESAVESGQTALFDATRAERAAREQALTEADRERAVRPPAPEPGSHPNARFLCTPETPWTPEKGRWVAHDRTETLSAPEDDRFEHWRCLGCGFTGKTELPGQP